MEIHVGLRVPVFNVQMESGLVVRELLGFFFDRQIMRFVVHFPLGVKQ